MFLLHFDYKSSAGLFKFAGNKMKLMLKYCLSVVSVFLFILNIKAQSPEKLDEKNGFQDIILMSDVTSNKKLEYDKDVNHPKAGKVALYTPVKGEYKTIGDIKIKDLEVKAYKNRIFEIRVLTEQDPNLYRGLQKLFGKPVYSIRDNHYTWGGESVSLSYRAYNKRTLELVYYAYQLEDLLKQDKKEKIESIADDF